MTDQPSAQTSVGTVDDLHAAATRATGLTDFGGDDYLEGACGADKLLAGGGYDEIVSDESSWCENGCTQVRDIVSCGGSEDTVVPDPTDLYSTKQCESVAN